MSDSCAEDTYLPEGFEGELEAIGAIAAVPIPFLERLICQGLSPVVDHHAAADRFA